MKKTFTILGLAFLSMQVNSQSLSVLTEDFEDQIIDASITALNPNGIVGSESAYAMSLQYNSVDLPYISLNYSANKRVLEADSVTITYDVDMFSSTAGFDGGINSVYYTDMVSTPFNFGEKIVQYTLYITGQDFDVSDVVFEDGKAYVTKGFASPISNSLSLINFDFQKTYLLGIYTASSPEELATMVCNTEFSNPNEIAICMGQVVANAPSIQSSLLVDNISVTTHTVTSIEDELSIEAQIVKAFNLSGIEVSADTKNEPIIVVYSDGRSERVYNWR